MKERNHMTRPIWAQRAHIHRDQGIQYRIEIGYMQGGDFITVDIFYSDKDPEKVAHDNYPGVETERF